MISTHVPRFVRGTPLFVFLLAVMGSLLQSVESFAVTTTSPSGTSATTRTATSLKAAASFADLRKAFPENPDIVAAGGYHHLETLAKADPKAALVDLVVDGLKGGASAVQPKTDKTAAVRLNEKLEALSLLLYGMGKGFSADVIDGEWDLVFAKQGQKSPSFQKLVGKTEKAGKSKNIFDVSSMIFHGNVRFWKWGKVSSSVKYAPTSDSFSKAMDGKIVIRKIVCTIVNAFFKFWKLPGIPFPVPKSSGFLEVIYLDEDIRVTKGNRGGFFVHFRPDFLQKAMAPPPYKPL